MFNKGQQFYDSIAQSSTTTAASAVIGPARLARCTSLAIMVHFGTSSTQGVLEVQASHNQSFPGTPFTVETIEWEVANSSKAVNVPKEWLGGFIRILPLTAVNGNGYSAWAIGRAD